jgi:enoyl-CoA hydratase
MTQIQQEPDVFCYIEGVAGIITLNRPRALNALNLSMVRQMRSVLDTWEEDAAVQRVIIEGAGGKAFCAGGDIRFMRQKVLDGDTEHAFTFWREEYQLNSRIKRYTKPFIALLDGIVMGGGAGVSLHGSHRIGSEKIVFAMPETGIGFFPDVGVSYDLARLKGYIGEWLALTGERLHLPDAFHLGLVTHTAASENFSALREALIKGDPIEPQLKAFATTVQPASFTSHVEIINACFGAPHLHDILERLYTHANKNTFAAQTASHLRTRCPLSLAIALEQVRRARTLSFEEVLMMDYRLATRMGLEPDFHEGVRAVVIDKGTTPQWHISLEDVRDSDLMRSYFETLTSPTSFSHHGA